MKKRILITITDEDFILLEKLANGYSKSVIIGEALRELERVKYPLISVGGVVGNDI